MFGKRKYFKIKGYWKDTKDEFDDFIVTNYDDLEKDGPYTEDEIFYFGLTEEQIKMDIGVAEKTVEDFVITEYEKI